MADETEAQALKEAAGIQAWAIQPSEAMLLPLKLSQGEPVMLGSPISVFFLHD